MDSLNTSFDKVRLNECTGLCISTVNNSLFTPDELNCFSKCTRKIPAMPAFTRRNRADSAASTSAYEPL